jgi:uncharacterized protein YdhG (YjbR/CyaY superfamily)
MADTMNSRKRQPDSIEAYIRTFSPPVRRYLKEMKRLVQESAPEAEGRISYRMPAFFLNGPLVYFAAYEHHIGFYPTAGGIRAFKDRLSKFKNSKGAVQFPLGAPLPKSLIRQIVRFRVAENRNKTRR